MPRIANGPPAPLSHSDATSLELPSPIRCCLVAFAFWLFAGQPLHGQVPDDPRFRIEVMAAIAKSGCNAGVCHGNQNGKGGFKLSLLGQDPQADYRRLTREENGRRVDRLNPEQSLVLQKPSGRLPHQGGRKLPRDGQAYRVLRTWIARGAPPPNPKTPSVTRLRVEPQDAVIWSPEDSLQLRVEAEFSDGGVVDVTEWAVYEASNFGAEVSPSGLVKRREFGEVAVLVRYLGWQLATTVAFLPDRGEKFSWPELPQNNLVDAHVDRKLRRLKTPPSPVCSDNVFVRRVYLDALGVPPTAEEARRFCSDTTSDKRQRLIDRVLARDAFADHWALKWSDILRNEEKVLDRRGVEAFHGWIREAIASDQPVNQLVRQLLVGKGSTYDAPAANFYRANRSPTVRGETAARLFLGVRLQCAKCHNHPFDHWTQDDYYDWAAVFARIDYKIVANKRKDKFDKNEFVGEQIVQWKDDGEVKNARTGQDASPRFLGGPAISAEAKKNRLEQAADWLASPENRLFVQSQTNWVWRHLMGRGIVEPVDDFRLTNPPSNAGLLEALSEEFVRSDFNLRALVRLIMSSRTYQTSSEPLDANRLDSINFARVPVRRLAAEQLLDAQSLVIGSPAEFVGYAKGLRAGQIPGVRRVRPRDKPLSPGDRFLLTFGKPQRLLACECERSNETTLNQALELVAGESLHERLQAAPSRLTRLAESDRSDEDVVAELFWSALCRPPTRGESAAAVEALRHADRRLEGVRDVAWALLNAKEFIFRQ